MGERGPGADSTGTRRSICAVALDEFVERGVADATLTRIAERTGVTKAAIYYHYRTKDELVAAVVRPYLYAVDACLAEWSGHPRACLASLLDVMVEHALVARLVDADPALALHQDLGVRLRRLPTRMREALIGDSNDPSRILLASAALGALRRPILRQPDHGVDLDEGARVVLVDAAARLLGVGNLGPGR